MTARHDVLQWHRMTYPNHILRRWLDRTNPPQLTSVDAVGGLGYIYINMDQWTTTIITKDHYTTPAEDSGNPRRPRQVLGLLVTETQAVNGSGLL